MLTTQRFFVTGTDTDAGKTYVSSALLRGFRLNGHAVSARKPVASGTDPLGQNADARALSAVTGEPVAQVNPLCFALPTAPHLAAHQQGKPLSVAVLEALLTAPAQPAAFQLIEGAGGWLLPLNDTELMADWVVAKRWPVLLVVGVKLGCLNHSLLTVREMRRAGVPILGYVANVLCPDMHFLSENLLDLQQRLQLPCLAQLPFAPAGPTAAQCQALADAVETAMRGLHQRG